MNPAIILCTINAKWIHPSLALRLLKANLGELEGQCRIVELALRQPLAEKVSLVRNCHSWTGSGNLAVLGLSVAIWNHLATIELIESLDAAGWPGRRPVVVLGGPEASFLPEDAALFRHADYVIRGEGEAAFRRLCEALMRGERPPRKFIDGDNVNAAEIDPGYRLYTNEDMQKKLCYVESSRGCPFRCAFCLSPAQGGGIRNFPLPPFFKNMETLISGGVRTFKFLDRSFNIDDGRAIEVLEFFLDRLETAARPFTVHIEIVPLLLTEKLAAVLGRFPPDTLRIEAGIQTLDAAAASRIGRAADAGKELAALRLLRHTTNAIVHADLIAALPGEGIESFGAGFDRLWLALTDNSTGAARADRARVEIQPGILKLLPGTPLASAEAADRFGLCANPLPPYEVIETAAMPRADLDHVKNFARFWELLVNRGVSVPPPGQPVFRAFMELSDKLLEKFGRNWGIDRAELLAAAVLCVAKCPNLRYTAFRS